MTALWTHDDIVRAAGGSSDGAPRDEITGLSIDTRTLKPGEVFVALKDARDGHDFVTKAFTAGASAAVVNEDYMRNPGDGALIRVADTLRALEDIGAAARARLSPGARVIAITGSAGKTGTKEMLRACLAHVGPTHAAEKSFNNHWGVPLTLARMPTGTLYAVIEIGMNHAGEITPLAKLVRPNVAVITNVGPVHLGHFASVDEIAEAKAEIFFGFEPGAIAVLNSDNPHYEVLRQRAEQRGATIVSFGLGREAQVRPEELQAGWMGSTIVVSRYGRRYAYRLEAPGLHLAMNSLAVVAVLFEILPEDALGTALGALAGIRPAEGRGARTILEALGGHILLIDESYNANPASMRAALAVLSTVPRELYHRRVAVLGDMLELGGEGERLHEALKEAVDGAGVDLVFACGSNMRRLFYGLTRGVQGGWAETSGGIEAELLRTVRAGDVVMVKGSFASRMTQLVAALKARFGVAEVGA